ncbi:MAG: hypothetical protein ACKVS8_13450 [Phycisphaerales bacterium]
MSALVALGLLCGFVGTGAALANSLDIFGPKGDTVDKKRAAVEKERDAMLTELYGIKPEIKERMKKAAGYATFSKTEVNLLLLASGNGYGVLVDQATGKKTYMRVGSLGGGVGVGVTDLRVIFIFNDAAVMKTFVEQGWQFGGGADASAKIDNKGVSASQTAKANVDVKDGTVKGGASSDASAGTDAASKTAATAATSGPMEIYQFTKSGISLQATVSGTKYWKDSELN